MAPSIRFAIFFVVLLVALGAIHLFVYKRASRQLGLSLRARRAFAGVLITGLVATFGARIVGRLSPGLFAEVLGVIGSVIALGTIICFAAMAVQLAMSTAARPIRWWWSRRRSAPAPLPDDVDTSRRTLLGQAAAGSALALGASTGGYAALFGRHDYVIEEVPVVLPNLPRTLDGYTIVQLSDVHLGTFVGEREIAAMIELVRSARPDLVVLTGDLVDHDLRFVPLLGEMARRLGEIAPVAAIAGNHDYYTGIDATLGTLRRAGADVLVNEARLIGDRGGEIALVGVDDVWARRMGKPGPNIADAVMRLPDRAVPRVLLCHNPSYFPTAAPHVDLQLSGHTHGGQVNVGVRPADLVLPFGYVAGRYQRDGAQLWVNRGFGTAGPPARIGAPPEVTKIVLASV